MAKKLSDDTSSQGIEIQELMAAPFIAAANANSVMATKQTQYLIENCFEETVEEDEEGRERKVHSPIMIVMTMTRSNLLPAKRKGGTPELEYVSSQFQIPLLTLVPFNSLCVTDVSVKFDLEIVSQESGKTSSNSAKKDETKLKGMVSYDASESQDSQYQRRNSSKLSVEMNAGSIPLPLGFTTILEMYTKNLNPTGIEKSAQ